MARQKTLFSTISLFFISITEFVVKINCHTEFQSSQTGAILGSHFLTDWPYFEHLAGSFQAKFAAEDIKEYTLFGILQVSHAMSGVT